MRPAIRAGLLALALTAACYRASRNPDDYETTVISVDNQSFVDYNVYVLPEASSQVRLGLAMQKKVSNFVVPAHLVAHGRMLRFVARPLASQAGSVSEEIVASPGDTIGLLIPPGGG